MRKKDRGQNAGDVQMFESISPRRKKLSLAGFKLRERHTSLPGKFLEEIIKEILGELRKQEPSGARLQSPRTIHIKPCSFL